MLVLAKAPVAGQVKTRLGADVGLEVAAELAAAALLDTLSVCEQVFEERHLALAGDLSGAIREAELREHLVMWRMHAQRGDGFAERLANAHADAAREGRPVVQIGMDTPHVSAAQLRAVADAVGVGNDAVLGLAEDGGWWVLAVTAPRLAAPLADVEMSTDHTGVDTLAALRGLGVTVHLAGPLADVDTISDAAAAAAAAPDTRFARLWSEVSAR